MQYKIYDNYYETLLNIDTIHNEDENFTKGHNAPYVPSSYHFLKKYFDSNPLKESDCLVDFGCGKGRVSIFANFLFHCSTVGIEYNYNLFKNAIENKERYETKHAKQPIEFIYGNAQHVDVLEKYNVFYFYNPFSILIFKQVIQNIIKIKRDSNFYVILFRPILQYIEFLDAVKDFQLVKKEKYDSPDKVRNDIEFYLYRYGTFK